MLENLSKYHLLLASKSPRRRELLSELRVPFKVVSMGGIDESYPEDMPKEQVPQYLSNVKANAFLKHITADDLVIAADTVVILDDKIYGKPTDIDDAKEILRKLSGRVHKVVSGVTLLTLDKRTSFSVTTEVKFTNLSEKDIDYYVENFMPLDKAGAYGIQEWIGCIAVESINGSYYNVMGLPVHRLYQELKMF